MEGSNVSLRTTLLLLSFIKSLKASEIRGCRRNNTGLLQTSLSSSVGLELKENTLHQTQSKDLVFHPSSKKKKKNCY